MLLIQLTGLSGAGKTTIARRAQALLKTMNIATEVVDGDEYRKSICRDLDFSKDGRMENIYRLGIICDLLSKNGIVSILSAINPYEASRQQVSSYGNHVKTVWINCSLDTVYQRDTKGLYKKALLPDDDPQKINNLTGINDPYEPPNDPDLVIDTTSESEEESTAQLVGFIVETLQTLNINKVAETKMYE